MYQGSILVLLQMVKKEATYIPVAQQGEAEWPYCALVMAARQSCSLRGNLE